MNVVARKVTPEEDGIAGYIAHPEGSGVRQGVLMVHRAHGVTADYKIDAYRVAQLGFNVLATSLFTSPPERAPRVEPDALGDRPPPNDGR